MPQCSPGTLTEEERKIMESHVTVAQRMLEKIRFNSRYKDVPAWALSHHEFLDGTGYPQGLKEGEIPLEARILTILDVYDALTAADRPYKRPCLRREPLTSWKRWPQRKTGQSAGGSF